MVSRFIDFLERPINIGSLVMFRVFFGSLMFIEMLRYLWHGWALRDFGPATFRFTYPFFDWISPLPGWGMQFVFLALAGLALAIATGLFYRVSTTLFTIGFSYIFLIDSTNYISHFYLTILLSGMLCFVPCHRAFSLDANRKPIITSDVIPRWCLLIFMGLFFIVYTFSGVAKINSDWLITGEPVQTWLQEYRTLPIIGSTLQSKGAALVISWSVMFFDLTIVPLMIWRRTRAVGVIMMIVFNLMNAFLFRIGVYPFIMIAATTLFMNPEWPHFYCRLWPAFEERKIARSIKPVLPQQKYMWLSLAICFFIIQIFLPLRHTLYPGMSAWTEQGTYFSWRMKLYNREGETRFLFRSDKSPELQEIDHRPYLTGKQTRKFKTRPDHVIQLAHYLERQLEADGHTGVSIYARSLCSLNGRGKRLLIKPDADLTKYAANSFRHHRWIQNL